MHLLSVLLLNTPKFVPILITSFFFDSCWFIKNYQVISQEKNNPQQKFSKEKIHYLPQQNGCILEPRKINYPTEKIIPHILAKRLYQIGYWLVRCDIILGK